MGRNGGVRAAEGAGSSADWVVLWGERDCEVSEVGGENESKEIPQSFGYICWCVSHWWRCDLCNDQRLGHSR